MIRVGSARYRSKRSPLYALDAQKTEKQGEKEAEKVGDGEAKQQQQQQQREVASAPLVTPTTDCSTRGDESDSDVARDPRLSEV